MASARRREVIVMGGSAGAVDALATILPSLPADFSLPIATVVHLPPDAKLYQKLSRPRTLARARSREFVFMGCSACVVDAFATILLIFSADLSLPISSVVHLPPYRVSNLAGALSYRSAVRIKEAED